MLKDKNAGLEDFELHNEPLSDVKITELRVKIVDLLIRVETNKLSCKRGMFYSVVFATVMAVLWSVLWWGFVVHTIEVPAENGLGVMGFLMVAFPLKGWNLHRGWLDESREAEADLNRLKDALEPQQLEVNDDELVSQSARKYLACVREMGRCLVRAEVENITRAERDAKALGSLLSPLVYE